MHYIFGLSVRLSERFPALTHWGRVTHIWVSKLTIIGSDNGLSPDRRQALIWTNAGILFISPLGRNLSEILIEILTFSFKKMRLKVSSAIRRPFCLGLNVLIGEGMERSQLEASCCIVIPIRTDQFSARVWWFCQFGHKFGIVGWVKFEFSGHYLTNDWEEWPQFWHDDCPDRKSRLCFRIRGGSLCKGGTEFCLVIPITLTWYAS